MNDREKLGPAAVVGTLFIWGLAFWGAIDLGMRIVN